MATLQQASALPGAGIGSKAAPQQARAWQVDFSTWKVGDPRYVGVDTELTMALTTFWFFCNRPTVAALMGLGTDMAAAARGSVGILSDGIADGIPSEAAALAEDLEGLEEEDAPPIDDASAEEQTTVHLSSVYVRQALQISLSCDCRLRGVSIPP